MSTTIAAPALTTWNLDTSHTSIEFSVRHLMIATVKGRFGGVRGTVLVDEQNPAASKVEIVIDAASVDTRDEKRDAHLRSADFFDAETHPTLTFRSTRLTGDPAGAFTLTGEITIRGVTREITLDGEAEGTARDPWGNEHAAFTLKGKLNRTAFGLNWNAALEAGGVLVSDDVKLTIDAQFIRAA